MALKKSQKSLKNWTSQEWGTKSGKKSAETGERYLPKSAIASLSPQEYAATSKKKREDTKKGKQHSKQPKKIAKKTASHRAEGGLMSDTSPRIEKAREAREEREELGYQDTDLQDAAYFAASLAPVTGEAIAAKEASESFEEGNYGEAAFLAAGAIPGLGVLPRLANKALRQSKKSIGKIKKADPLEIGVDESLFNAPLSASKADSYYNEGLKSVEENFNNASFGKGKLDDSFRDKPVDKGTKTSLRLNLNSNIPDVERGLSKATTVHLNKPSGPVASYVAKGTVDDAVFEVDQKGRALISSKVDNKFPAMGVTGKWNPDEDVFQAVANNSKLGELGHPLNVVEIKFNPFSDHLFKDASTGWAVKSAEKATTIGDRVFAIGVKYHSKADAPKALTTVSKTKKGEKIEGTPPPSTVRFPYNKGGLMYNSEKNEGKNMKKPEELYHGGMMSDCKGVMSAPEIIIGVDPVSGNDIPLGSKAENVRDDMPAMLSEGEYVLPADVVKWHGLKHIQGMHDEASMGLMGMAVEGYLGSELEEEPEKKKESKKDKKTPEGIKVEVAEVKTENKAKKLEKEDSEYAKGLAEGGFPDLNKDGKITQADILKGRGVFYGGGLMQYDEGGLSLDDSADEAFDAYQQMINDPDYKRKQELQERYDREEDLTEDEVKELSSLSAPEKDSSDIADEVTSRADEIIETDTEMSELEKQKELDELVNSLMSQSSGLSGEDEYSAFSEGLMSGLKAAKSNLGDKLAEVELKFGDKTYTPFEFLRDNEGFFNRAIYRTIEGRKD